MIGTRAHRTCCSLVALFLLTAVSSAHGAQVAVASGVAINAPGGVADADLSLTGAANVEAASFVVRYDSAVLQATSVSDVALPNTCLFDSNTALTGEVRIAVACEDPLAVNGALFRITFQGVSRGASALTLAGCTLNEGFPACSAVDGDATVGNCEVDVDASGRPANPATDLVYLARSLLGLAPVPSSFRNLDPNIPSDAVIGAAVAAAGSDFDVDGNGSVDVATDVVYITRHLLGLSPVPQSFRDLDPSILANAQISAAIDGLCP